MKHHVIYIALAAIIGFAALGNSADAQTPNLKPQFFTVMPDVPIMPQFSELRDSAVIFDKPDGRVAETIMVGRVAEQNVKQFYARALPALGWRALRPDVFTRADEVLSLEYDKNENGEAVVTLNLSPYTP